LYDRSDLERILGARAFHGGIRYAGTFGIDSYAYCRGLRAALERRGVRIYEGTPALRIDGQGVETPGGRVRSAKVAVLADTGLPSLGLAPAAIHPVRTFLSISRPLRASQIEALFPSGDRLMVWDSALAYQYFRLTGEGRLLAGLGAPARHVRLGRARRPACTSHASCSAIWLATSGDSKSSSSTSGRA
jgi:gamma-glutamylputrescine oxidase